MVAGRMIASKAALLILADLLLTSFSVSTDHFSAGILSPGIAPISPNVCKIQINTTTNTTILSKLLIAPAIGI
jgi:hypothetical protein